MDIRLAEGRRGVAIVSAEETVITDVTSALDLAMAVRHETGAEGFVIGKELICEEFFMLSTGLAGEILQKLINYHVKMAVHGDFSRYTSKPLKDFIREANKGRDFFFVAAQAEALDLLERALRG